MTLSCGGEMIEALLIEVALMKVWGGNLTIQRV